MTEAFPTLIAIIIALIGGAGGIAAIMKVNADNSQTVAEGASQIVKTIREELTVMDRRLQSVEQYVGEIEVWSGRVLALTEKAIEQIPEAKRDPFRIEQEALARARPRRRTKKVEAG